MQRVRQRPLSRVYNGYAREPQPWASAALSLNVEIVLRPCGLHAFQFLPHAGSSSES